MADEVQFARLDNGSEVAYRVMSDADGPVIVHAPGGPWAIDLLPDDPMYARFLDTLGGYGRLVVYDRPGIGSSDPFDPDRDWLEQMAEARFAVMDAVESDRAWIVGAGLPECATTMQAHPNRILGAVTVNGMSRRRFERFADAAIDRAREPTLEATPSRAGDPGFVEWIRRARRMSASGADLAAFMAAQRESVERYIADAAPIVDGPPTLLIRRRNATSAEEFEWWTSIFLDAECVTIEGADAGLLGLDAGLIAELAAGFITGTPVVASAERRLLAVLFTDLVDSTPTAAASGDAVWRSTLDHYEANLHGVIQRHHGTVVKHTGDGAVATFPSGTEAIAAAIELLNTTRDLGLEGRTGIHVGEVEQRGDDIGGIAVNLAARVMGEADPGGIVVTAAVNDTTQGGRYSFSDLGNRTLKGIDRPCHLFAVEPLATR